MAGFITTTILLATAAYCLQITAAAPQMSGPTATMGSLAEGPECSFLADPRGPQHYCNKFGYVKTLFPGPRNTLDSIPIDTSNTARFRSRIMKEFRDFIPLMDSECSQKLGTLLCFLYFPFCSDTSNGPMIVTPCRSLCEEVTDPDSNCTKALASHGISWARHFNCSATFVPYHLENKDPIPVFPDTSTQCADQKQAHWEVTKKPVTVKEPPTEEEPTDFEETTAGEDQTPAEETTAAVDETTAREDSTPTQEPCLPTCTDDLKCHKCNIRRQSNAKTFARNDYTFAFKCKLNSFTTLGCRQALNCTVLETIPIKASGDCSIAPHDEAAPVDSTVLVLGTKASGCENCFEHPSLNVRPGETYFVAGFYERKSPNCVLWNLGEKTVIAEWNEQNHGQKMHKYLEKGHKNRKC